MCELFIVFGIILIVLSALLFCSSIKLYHAVHSKKNPKKSNLDRGKTYTEWELYNTEEEN